MSPFVSGYIRFVDAVNYRIGRFVMYGIFIMVGILLWSSISKTFFLPSRRAALWRLGQHKLFTSVWRAQPVCVAPVYVADQDGDVRRLRAHVVAGGV